MKRETRKVRLQTKVTPTEAVAVRQLAKRQRITRSTFIRNALLLALQVAA